MYQDNLIILIHFLSFEHYIDIILFIVFEYKKDGDRY